jgi:IS4 transposase
MTALFWSLILGFSTGNSRTLSGLRRIFQKTAGFSLVSSSFQDRFTKEMADFMRQACLHALDNMPGLTTDLKGRLSRFKDILVTDSTVIRLHDFLEDVYPGCRKNHSKAALKAHVVLSVTGKGKHTLKITEGTYNDGKAFVIDEGIKGKLALFDLGYYVYTNFTKIHHHGGFFVSRLKTNAKPIIISTNGSQAKDDWGCKTLPEILSTATEQKLDVIAQFKVDKKTTANFRVVAIRHTDTGEYHTYVTNLPYAQFTTEDIATLYTFRWSIELFYRELKGSYRMEQMPSRRREVVESLLYAAFITCVLSKSLLQAITQSIQGMADRIRLERWARLFYENAELLLLIMTAPMNIARYLQRQFLTMIETEIIDPNKKRLSLLQRTEYGQLEWLK